MKKECNWALFPEYGVIADYFLSLLAKRLKENLFHASKILRNEMDNFCFWVSKNPLGYTLCEAVENVIFKSMGMIAFLL